MVGPGLPVCPQFLVLGWDRVSSLGEGKKASQRALLYRTVNVSRFQSQVGTDPPA